MTGAYDFGALSAQVAAILKYSQDYPFEPNVDAMMNKWLEAKSSIIKRFGGKLVVRTEQPIKVELSEEQQDRRFSEFVSALDENNLLTVELENFLIDNKQSFFNNRVTKPCPSLNIKEGMRLSKSLKYFISDPMSVRWAQDVASTFMQEDKVEGYLCLSVDPRDFLTLSENMLNWSSCHALDDGYRAGDVSYMVDETTVIAYIATDKQERLRCMPRGMKWNNKKWRMLVHVGKNCIYYNKQYPFSSDDLLDKTYDMVMEHLVESKLLFKGLATRATFCKPTDCYGFKHVKIGDSLTELSTNYLVNGFRIFATCDVIDVSEYNGYCDIIFSTTYTPIVSIREAAAEQYINACIKHDLTAGEELQAFRKLFGVKIGGTVPCVYCGEGIVHRHDSFLCLGCIADLDADEDFFLKCDCCNHKLDPDFDDIVFHEKIAYCRNCYNALVKDGVIKEEEEE